jgi:phage terminase large subunit GpA-like protein
VTDCLQVLERLWTDTSATYRPPLKLSLSEWADAYAYLSPESSADTGKWRTIPYQRGIIDAITNPSIERITVMKSARVGYTKIINHGSAITHITIHVLFWWCSRPWKTRRAIPKMR